MAIANNNSGIYKRDSIGIYLALTEDGHAKTSNPQAVAKFQAILTTLWSYIPTGIHGECCRAASMRSRS